MFLLVFLADWLENIKSGIFNVTCDFDPKFLECSFLGIDNFKTKKNVYPIVCLFQTSNLVYNGKTMMGWSVFRYVLIYERERTEKVSNGHLFSTTEVSAVLWL